MTGGNQRSAVLPLDFLFHQSGREVVMKHVSSRLRQTNEHINNRLCINGQNIDNGHVNYSQVNNMDVNNGDMDNSNPDKLRAFIFHGIDLSVKGTQGIGDCPFCLKEGKFSVDGDTSKWKCWVCGMQGNAIGFMRTLYAESVKATTPAFLEEVAHDRRLCYSSTVSAWGVCRSIIPPHPWLIPGYSTDGKIHQIYKRASMRDGKGPGRVWRYLPTPGVYSEGFGHGIHIAVGDVKATRPNIDVFEGPWDGAAFWEVAQSKDSNVIAVPGCNVWSNEWTKLCAGKNVTVWFDSDHPREGSGRKISAGYEGVRRVIGKIKGSTLTTRWLRWGEEGYDPNKPSGWDIRDALSGSPNKPLLMVDRKKVMLELRSKVEDAPKEWEYQDTSSSKGSPHIATIESQRCHTWNECEAAWRDAMYWRAPMASAMPVLLAVCASTQQGGNQLFVQLVGSAGSGKTTMCEGLLVSRHCHHLEHLTGFHSGWKESGDDKEKKDCSLIARINGKTLVTPEADIMVSSPKWVEIMSQQRRIFDGKSGATYKNSSEDTLYVGLRTPWIMAGTLELMNVDQSRLGDRFLRVIIEDPTEDEKRSILRSALRSERVAMMSQSNGTSGSLVDPKTRKAYALTGGYVDWLRANIEDLLPKVNVSTAAEDCCIDLAELSADLRARPNENKWKKDPHDGKELPTRLARQNIRLATHLAVVLNKTSIDGEVIRILRKVAMDTACGHSLNIVQWMCSPNPKADSRTYQECGGIAESTLAVWCNMITERMVNYLLFLRKIDVLVMKNGKHGGNMWCLTDRMYDLYSRVISVRSSDL